MEEYVKNKHDGKVKKSSLVAYCNVQKDRFYELLCLREENKNWKRYLRSKMFEYSGNHKYFDNKVDFLSIVGKAEALYDMDYDDYRKTIFEIMTCFDRLAKKIKGE